MISKENLKDIKKAKFKKLIYQSIDYVIFIASLIVSYSLNFSYKEDTTLFNDKLIDVCSIFFGVFIGCMYLFKAFKNVKTYDRFMKFSKNLLYLNLIIISLSFIIILVNPILPEKYTKSYNLFLSINLYFNFKPRVLLFSIYVSLYAVVIYNIFRFIKIIFKILKYTRE